MKIKRLYLKAFRGATKPLTLDFDPGKNISMIFGENGNGKSTITDAFDSLCNSTIGSLQDKSSVDKTYIRSLGAQKSDLKIELTTDTSVFRGTHSPTSNILIKNPSTGLPIVKSLRRSLIIGLIDSKPSQRYDALKAYLDIDLVFKSEESLRKAVRNIESDVQRFVSILTESKGILSNIWEDEGKPDGDYMKWAEQESNKDISEENKNHKELKAILDKWGEINRAQISIDQSLNENARVEKQIESLEEELEILESEAGDNQKQLLNVLKEAEKFIDATDPLESCPVCNSSIEREDVLQSLQTQINSMNELDRVTKALQSLRRTEDNNKAVISNKLSDFRDYIKRLKELLEIDCDIDFSDSMNILDEILLKDESIEAFDFMDNSKEEFKDVITEVNDNAESIKKTIERFNAIKRHYDSIVDNEKKAENTQSLLKIAKASLEIADTKRKEFIDNELDSISSVVEGLYSKLHPGEGLGGIKLFLKPNMKNSIELTANFHSASVTPQSIYSESHLDTLGICIFIALAKKYSSSDAILVLDDVVMSVDENHLDRFIDVLHDVSSNFAHVIIATHYRPWRDRYRNNRAPASKVQLIELREWSKENGIRLQNGKIALDELEQLLDPATDFHRENISSFSGRILENILDFITILFSSKLPRKPRNDFQLRELLDGLSKKLLKVFKVQHMKPNGDGTFSNSEVDNEVEMKAIIDRLKQLSAVRNQVGAHYNFDGSLVSDPDVKEFGKLTLEFAKLLVCPENGSLPDKDKSGSYLETRSGSIKLFPVKEPSN